MFFSCSCLAFELLHLPDKPAGVGFTCRTSRQRSNPISLDPALNTAILPHGGKESHAIGARWARGPTMRIACREEFHHPARFRSNLA
jgi:hypothetical protein